MDSAESQYGLPAGLFSRYISRPEKTKGKRLLFNPLTRKDTMAYQETQTITYGQRLGNALKGIVGGFIMFVAGTVLLFWNEGNFVKTRKSLSEAQDATVPVASVAALDASLEGKLIHASAPALTDEVLQDPQFGVSEKAIALKRRVEFYQWVESSQTQTRDKMGGGQEKITTYTYRKTWCSSPENSADFHDPAYQDKNWVWLSLDDQDQYAGSVTFGAYTLPGFFVKSIPGRDPVNVTPPAGQIDAWTRAIANHPRAPKPELAEQDDAQSAEAAEEAAAAPAGDEAPAQWVHVGDDTVYFGLSPNQPDVGDLRVSFVKVPTQTVSLLGKVKGATFERYTTKNGKSVSRLEAGEVGPEDMFAHAHGENKMLTWILRIVGMVLVCAGLRGIFGILEAIAKVIPMLGSIVGAGVGMVCVVAGLAWSFIWIAIAWVAYRPLVGIPLLVAAVAGFYWLGVKGCKAAPPAASAAPPAA